MSSESRHPIKRRRTLHQLPLPQKQKRQIAATRLYGFLYRRLATVQRWRARRWSVATNL
jgi:hypothetical protein